MESTAKKISLTNPLRLFVDIIIQPSPSEIVLVERGVAPFGWALAGGIIDECEAPYEAAMREAKEETALNINLLRQFQSYSFVSEDGSCEGLTIVFLADGAGILKGGDDVKRAAVFSLRDMPPVIPAHRKIIEDFITFTDSGRLPSPHTKLPAYREKSHIFNLKRVS